MPVSAYCAFVNASIQLDYKEGLSLEEKVSSRRYLLPGFSTTVETSGAFADFFKQGQKLGTNEKRTHRLTDHAEEQVRSQLDLLEVGGIHGLG